MIGVGKKGLMPTECNRIEIELMQRSEESHNQFFEFRIFLLLHHMTGRNAERLKDPIAPYHIYVF